MELEEDENAESEKQKNKKQKLNFLKRKRCLNQATQDLTVSSVSCSGFAL